MDIISSCVHCAKPWHRYNAQKCCIVCKMEVTTTTTTLLLPLCKERHLPHSQLLLSYPFIPLPYYLPSLLLITPCHYRCCCARTPTKSTPFSSPLPLYYLPSLPYDHPLSSLQVLLCKDCDRAKPPVPKDKLFCPLCQGKNKGHGQGHGQGQGQGQAQGQGQGQGKNKKKHNAKG